ncbi:hypothetical protein ACIBCH_20480 [Amycolatopsis thailandensis]|uniref:hypothetical protein n=1 Tax=Amycolatopsis thailandensis TaxID=589330 RepID=UPI00379BB469
MKPRMIVVLVAAAAVVGALIWLLVPVSAASPGGRALDCGNGFASGDLEAGWAEMVTKSMQSKEGEAALVAELQQAQKDTRYSTMMEGYQAACGDALVVRRSVGFGIAGVGVVVLLGALLMRRSPRASGVSSSPPPAA